MCESDVDALLCIFTDPRVMAAFGVAPFTREQMERWLHRNLDHQAAFGYGLFSVILKAEERLIGDCGLERMEADGAAVDELGYDFRSDYWNQGYATEAVLGLIDYARWLGIPSLLADTFPSNPASARVLAKAGFVSSGMVQINLPLRGGLRELERHVIELKPD